MAADHWPPASPWPSGGQIHCPFVRVDLTPVDGWRSDEVTMRLREAYYQILQGAFDEAGIGWRTCLVQPRGNGALVLVPPHVSPPFLVEPLMTALRAGLRAHNRAHNESARMRFRLGVHIGTVRFDPAGPAGHAIELLGTLQDSAEFAAACAASSSELGFVTSDYFYEDVIRHSHALIEPAMFESIKATGPEGKVPGWAYLPPGPGGPADPRMSVPHPRTMPGADETDWIPEDWSDPSGCSETNPRAHLAGLSDLTR